MHFSRPSNGGYRQRISHLQEDDAGLTDLKELLKTKGLHIHNASIHAGKENEAKSPHYISANDRTRQRRAHDRSQDKLPVSDAKRADEREAQS